MPYTILFEGEPASAYASFIEAARAALAMQKSRHVQINHVDGRSWVRVWDRKAKTYTMSAVK